MTLQMPTSCYNKWVRQALKRSTMSQSSNYLKSYPKVRKSAGIWCISFSISSMTIGLLGYGIPVLDRAIRIHTSQERRDTALAKNQFWLEVEGEVPFSNDSVGDFARDLQAWLAAPKLVSELNTMTLDSVKYLGLNGALGITI